MFLRPRPRRSRDARYISLAGDAPKSECLWARAFGPISSFYKILEHLFYSREDVRGWKAHIARLKSGVRLKVVFNVKYFQVFKLWTLTVSSWFKYVLWLCSTSTKYKNLVMFEIRKIFFARACGARDTVHLRFDCGHNVNLAFVSLPGSPCICTR